MKCWICDAHVKRLAVMTRDGKKKPIHFCPSCDFYFFGKGAAHFMKTDRFEAQRLKTANLKIPDMKTDFQNGLKQAKGYVKEYIQESDKNKSVLEIGCSWGYFLYLLKNKQIKPVGVEINPVRTRYVRKKLAIPCYESMEALEETKISFDKIFLFYVVQYIEKPRAYFERLLGLLNKNGSIHFVTPNINDALLSLWRNKAYADFFFEKMTVAYYSVKAIKKMLSRLADKHSFSFHVKTRQGYSFLNHTNWYFSGTPRTTGMVGGDNFISDIVNVLRLSKRKPSKEISGLIENFDRRYRSLIEKQGLGNQIIVTITRHK